MTDAFGAPVRPLLALRRVPCLVLSLWLLLGGTAVAAEVPTPLSFLAYGELRGHLEPCGCDPTTDLGGIRRLALVLARERSVQPDLALFDLGNGLPLKSEAPLKTPFLLEASARLAPGAALLNQLELERLGEISALRAKNPRALPPYVLSNALPPASRPREAEVKRSGKGWVALGYTYVPEFKDRLQRVGPPLLKAWQTLLAYVPVGQRVLLFSGPGEDLQAIIKAKLFDVIISSNTAELATVIGSEEKAEPERLVRLKTPDVRMVPLGGQGLLRGGELQFAEARPIAEYLKAKAAPAEGWLKTATPVTWLTPEANETESPLQDLYLRYSEAGRQAFRGQQGERLKALKDSPYAGSAACQSCHSEAYQSYQKSQHAHAMATLQAKAKQEDGECVSCHVVGAQAPGGFVSLEASPHLANVQCENCHGPRLAHSKNPALKAVAAVDAKAVCSSCHNAQHSPKFNFATYWPRIKHGLTK